jgi:hypothetical protein
MKKLMMIIVSMMAAMSGFSQTTVAEPEFVGQVIVVNADSTTILLQKEQASMKASSTNFGLIPIPGSGLLDKSSTNLVVKGKEAKVMLEQGRLTFIVRAEKNDIDPVSILGVFQFDVKKKKRLFKMAEINSVGGWNFNMSFNNVKYVAKKYGEHSYLIVIENPEPGQYGIVLNDIYNVSTFGVK